MIKSKLIELEVPALKIRNIENEIQDLSYEIIQDKVIVQGIIDKQIFYVGTDNVVHHHSDEMSFCTFIDIPGAAPDMEAVIDIEIEKILAHLNPEGTRITQKAILNVFVKVEDKQVISILLDETGKLVELEQLIAEGEKQISKERQLPLNQMALKIEDVRDEVLILTGEQSLQAVIPVVVGENSKQILVEEVEEIKPVEEVNVEFKKIVRKEIMKNWQQKLLEDITDLDCPAIKVKDIKATIENLEAKMDTDDLAAVTGIVVKDVAYVCKDNIVHHQEIRIPFGVDINLPEAFEEEALVPMVEIENISHRLLNKGNKLKEIIILKVCVKVIELEFIKVVTSITGPGITTETVMIKEEVIVSLEPLVTEVKSFPVVTQVFDPEGILSTVIKKVLVLNVIGEGKIPIEVVVFAK